MSKIIKISSVDSIVNTIAPLIYNKNPIPGQSLSDYTRQVENYINSSPTLVSEINFLASKGYSISVSDAQSGISSSTNTDNKIINLGVMTSNGGASSADIQKGSAPIVGVTTLAVNVGQLAHEVGHALDGIDGFRPNGETIEENLILGLATEADATFNQIIVASEMYKNNPDNPPYISVSGQDNGQIQELYQKYMLGQLNSVQLHLDLANMYGDGSVIVSNKEGNQMTYPGYYSTSDNKPTYSKTLFEDVNGKLFATFTKMDGSTKTKSVKSIVGSFIYNHMLLEQGNSSQEMPQVYGKTKEAPAPVIENSAYAPNPMLANIQSLSNYANLSMDPIVINYDKTNISIIQNAVYSPYYDFNKSGISQQTAWIGTGTDFLVTLDSNGNPQLIGNNTQSGYQQLAQYDTNGDGIINSSDQGYTKLYLWNGQDINNLKSGDIISLSQANIVSISLSTTETNIEYDGATIVDKSTVTFTDGTTTDADEADLSTSLINTTTQKDQELSSKNLSTTIATTNTDGTTSTIDLTTLPDFHGYGVLSSLTANDNSLFLLQIVN